MTEPTPKPRPARRRARKPDGQFKGDNPSTPEVNEAWEPTEVEATLPKKKLPKYTPKPKVSATSTAGKYGVKAKVRPGLGGTHTTSH